jgi:hypothetical protein
MTAPTVLRFPFRGLWVARNSPARRVPSHGTTLFGTTFAIDFIAVDERGRSAPPSWRAMLATEPPENFTGFGAPVLAPASGIVVAVHDGEPDHAARRSPAALLQYAASQASRVRSGVFAIAGNHVVLALGDDGPFVLLAHLRRGSLRVDTGTAVAAGQQVAECGNSGNSTEPHVHLQVTDSLDWPNARGLPVAFRQPTSLSSNDGETWVPGESEVFDAG